MKSPKLRVLHIHTLPRPTGSGTNTLLTMQACAKEGYDVEFACAPGGALADMAQEQGFRFHPIKHLVQPISPYHDLMALWELISLMKREKYDLVHPHNSKAGFVGRLAARYCKVPLVIHTIHGYPFYDFEKWWKRKLFIMLERFAARFADRLIVVSNPLRDWSLKLGIGTPEQFITIYSGIEIDKFRPAADIDAKKKELGVNPTDRVVGLASNLWKDKGHKELIQAAKIVVEQVDNVKFMLVGDGYLKNELVELAQSLGVADHVVFPGFRTDISEVTSTFDIATLPSYCEGMGRVLLEGMVLGKPVVATTVGGIVDIVNDGETGILVPPADPDSLAKALIKLLKDDALRTTMGEAGKKSVDEKFTADTMVSKILALYKEELTRKGMIGVS